MDVVLFWKQLTSNYLKSQSDTSQQLHYKIILKPETHRHGDLKLLSLFLWHGLVQLCKPLSWLSRRWNSDPKECYILSVLKEREREKTQCGEAGSFLSLWHFACCSVSMTWCICIAIWFMIKMNAVKSNNALWSASQKLTEHNWVFNVFRMHHMPEPHKWFTYCRAFFF